MGFKNVTFLMRSARVLGAGGTSLFLQRSEIFVVYSKVGRGEGWKVLSGIELSFSMQLN